MLGKFMISAISIIWGFNLSVQAQEATRELAEQAANIVGIGREGLCSSCHATSSERTLERWATATRRVDDCLQIGSSQDKLKCISDNELNEAFTLSAAQLGFYSTALHLPVISTLIEDSFQTDVAQNILEEIKINALMPFQSDKPLSANEVDTLIKWSRLGMPYLNELLEHEQTQSNSCKQTFSDALTDHIVAMKYDSWRSRNEAEGLPMFACSTDGSCFRQQRNGRDIFPDVSTDEAKRSWKFDPDTEMRVLTSLRSYSLHYWIRSSPDGRFVGFGGRPSGIIDLQSLLAPTARERVIEVSALYDPGFFPDNSGFMFQGNGTGLCNMSILKNSRTTSITFRESACTRLIRGNQIPLYQAVGASLNGGDYLAVTSSYLRDAGTTSTLSEHIPSEDIAVASSNFMMIHPLAYNGETWVRKASQRFRTPYEIDWVISNTNELLISRTQTRHDGIIRSNGYNIYQLSKSSSGQYQTNQVAQLCVDGLKGDFSLDDRFFVTYSYIRPDHWRLLGYSSANDPVFRAKLRNGSANVYLFDLYTKRRYTITNVGARQYALYPHFRSDGWIYFEIYDMANNTRLILASNAAILAEKATPIP